MIFVPRDATSEQALDIVREWIALLVREDYQQAIEQIGIWGIRGDWTPESLKNNIKRYRSSEYFPDVEEFTVTDWRKAHGGKPDPRQEVEWYQELNDNFPLAGAITVDLPLNGRWSDHCVEFVLFKNENPAEGYILGLEEMSSLHSRNQEQLEFEAWEQQNADKAVKGEPTDV